jgi:hypothetical protein
MACRNRRTAGLWSLALPGAGISGWGLIAAFGAALAVIHANAMNLYPLTIALPSALSSSHKPRRWEQLATVLRRNWRTHGLCRLHTARESRA